MKLNNPIWSIAGLLLSFFLTMNAAAETSYRVKSYDTLSHVVARFYPSSRYSRAQIMVAILAKNPDAFKDGNINYLLRGKRLNLPNDEVISQTSKADARRLISQHERFFRSGITGVGLTDSSLTQEVEREKTIEVVKKQTQKISALEEERNKLRKRLDDLFQQKQKRDKELQELEKQITKYSSKENSKPLGTVEQIEKRNLKLKETNEILQKKLIESKSELAENELSTMTLERKLSNLRETIDQSKNGADPSTAGSTASLTSPLSTSTQSAEIQKASEGSTFAKLKDEYYWVLPLLLLVALLYFLWLLWRWVFGRKKEKVVEDFDDSDKDYATLINDYDSIDYLDSENIEDEASLEPSIKLDVARAYIEADDNESALNILEEILQEGSNDQKKEAEEIISFIRDSAHNNLQQPV